MPIDETARRGYRFAGFGLERQKRRLLAPDGTAVPLSARAYDVLLHLVENRQRVVGKDELLKAVWPSTIVEENNLTQAIAALRRALGDSRESPRFIVTVPGRGYQFIADAEVIEATEAMASSVQRAAAPEAEPLTAQAAELASTLAQVAEPAMGTAAAALSASPCMAPPASIPAAATAPEPRVGAAESGRSAEASLPVPTQRRTLMLGAAAAATLAVAGGAWWWRTRLPSGLLRSIAVLPFRPLLPDSANPALEFGVTAQLINRLSRIPGLVVSPLSSVMRFANGDMDPAGIAAKLGVDAVVEGSLQVHADLVRLNARLLAADGRSLWANSYTEPAGELLTVQDRVALQIASAVAVELSEDARRHVLAPSTTDVEAWQLYANGHFLIERRDASAVPQAIAMFRAALDRDPNFAEAWAGLSDAHSLTAIFLVEPPAKAWSLAREAAVRALEINPGLASGLRAMGHVVTQYDRDLERGRELYERALRLKPDYANALGWLALNRVQAGEIATAVELNRKAQAIEPASFTFIAQAGLIRFFHRGYDESERILARLVEVAPYAPLPRQFLAQTLLALRKPAEVVRLLEGRDDPAPTAYSNLARARAQLGDVRAARAQIDRLARLRRDGFGVGFDIALIHTELGEKEPALAALETSVADFSGLTGYLNVHPALDPLRDDPRFRALSRRLRLA
jgi:DNA-binding winged helix-turn-helix (wHTH) protein/TolB-like protein